MDALTISAIAACKRHGLDPGVWMDIIADKVNGSNAAYFTLSGGINRSNVAEYSESIARSIRGMVKRGETEKLSLEEIVAAARKADLVDLLNVTWTI